MSILKRLIIIFIFLFSIPIIYGKSWNTYNDPKRLVGRYFEKRLVNLPLKGKTSKALWSGYYWPDQKSGIAYRWQDKKSAFDYKTLSTKKLMYLKQEQLDKLSPAEKYDLLMRKFNYPTVDFERRRTSKASPDWYGLCHGFALASLYYREPKTKSFLVKLPGAHQSIRVNFSTSDIKALIALAVEQSDTYKRRRFRMVGTRCSEHIKSSCWDVNPGAFHLTLTNLIGLRKLSFIADFGVQGDVWNHPIISYYSSYTNQRGLVKVETRVIRAVNTSPSLHQVGPITRERLYRYTLELNEAGEITGGEWISRDRPDFLWDLKKFLIPGHFRGLSKLVELR